MPSADTRAAIRRATAHWRRMIPLALLILVGFVPLSSLAEPTFHWRAPDTPAPQQRSLPPVCTLCLHGEVGFNLLASNTQVNLRAEYIVNYNDYGVVDGRSGTLILGFFLFPGDFESLQADDINPYNYANLRLSSLGGNEAFFADVDETGPLFGSPPAVGEYYAYLLLGEVVDVFANGAFRIELHDFALMHADEQPNCGGTTCLFAAPGGVGGDSGGNSGGVGQGGGSEGGGDREGIDRNEPPREPTSRRDCNNTVRNRANADRFTVSGDTATLMPVLDNDTVNREGGFGIAIDAPPGNGSAVVSGDTIRYTPAAGFEGDDFLTYKIGSLCGSGTPPARVEITVERTTIVPSGGCPMDVKLPGELAARSGATSLLNISTRGLVGDCGDTLRAGFINVDSETTYFIRGRGPSLGGANPLADPRIRLLGIEEQNGQLVEVERAGNDDWAEHITANCLVEGGQLMPTDEREAGLMITLAPGAYIAILESAEADGSCGSVYGNGIIEVNDVRLFPDDVQP